MHVTLAELAQLIGGQVCGDAQLVVHGVASLEQAQPGELSFVTSRKYLARLATSRAAAILVDRSLPVDRPAIRVPDPMQAFAILLEHLYPLEHPAWQIDARAILGPEVVIGAQVHIGPNVVIGRGTQLGDRVIIYPGTYVGEQCEIGADSILYANVSLYPRVRLGRAVIVHSGAVIGSDGFGFHPLPDGSYRKLPHVGRVVVGNHVEIGANACIDRAMIGDTIIEDGVKLDNLVTVAHNSVVGAHSVLAAQVGLAGSTRLGARVRMGGQVGVADHVTIGEGASIAGHSGVTSDVASGATMFGYPAVPSMVFKRLHFYTLRLRELFQQVKQLQRRLSQLEGKERQR